jgi:hypothetical protein
MNIARQFSVSMVNRPGILANICRALADAKVNILALAVSDSVELGLLRIVVDKPEMAKSILSKFDTPISETEVLAIEMPNRPGALAGAAEKLGRAHINLNYAYATTGTPGGRTTVVLKVQYPEKAIKVLHETDRKEERKNLFRANFRSH